MNTGALIVVATVVAVVVVIALFVHGPLDGTSVIAPLR